MTPAGLMTSLPLPAPFTNAFREAMERLSDGPLAPALDLFTTTEAVVAQVALPGVKRDEPRRVTDGSGVVGSIRVLACRFGLSPRRRLSQASIQPGRQSQAAECQTLVDHRNLCTVICLINDASGWQECHLCQGLRFHRPVGGRADGDFIPTALFDLPLEFRKIWLIAEPTMGDEHRVPYAVQIAWIGCSVAVAAGGRSKR